MAAWKILLWPLLVMGAGAAWIFVTGALGQIVPEMNKYIDTGTMSVQTFEGLTFSLNWITTIPGIALIVIGLGLVVDAVWHGRGEDY